MIALPSSQPSFRGGWLFLFQLAGKENMGHAANINIKDVVSLVLDQLACIAYKVQLRLFVFHVCSFLRQFSKTFFDRLAATVNSRCVTERIFRLLLANVFQAPEPSFRGKNPHDVAARRVDAQHQFRQVVLQYAGIGIASPAEMPLPRITNQFPVFLQSPGKCFIDSAFAFPRKNSRG
jgi:hypothetical protein